jgi:hypothetical protein
VEGSGSGLFEGSIPTVVLRALYRQKQKVLSKAAMTKGVPEQWTEESGGGGGTV